MSEWRRTVRASCLFCFATSLLSCIFVYFVNVKGDERASVVFVENPSKTRKKTGWGGEEKKAERELMRAAWRVGQQNKTTFKQKKAPSSKNTTPVRVESSSSGISSVKPTKQPKKIEPGEAQEKQEKKLKKRRWRRERNAGTCTPSTLMSVSKLFSEWEGGREYRLRALVAQDQENTKEMRQRTRENKERREGTRRKKSFWTDPFTSLFSFSFLFSF